MQNSRKKKQKVPMVKKPFIRGRMIDRTTPGAALKFFAFTVMMIFVYFMSMIVATLEISILNLAINLAIIGVTWMIFWQSGIAAGADAVNQGEIMYQRREKGRPVADWEAEMCYHPLKGLTAALIGSLPLLLASVVFASVAQRQMTTLGVLPTWVSGFESRPEIGGALAYYHQEATMDLEAVLRVVIHVATMPWLSIVGVDNKDAVLVLERLSPVLNLLPALSYGVGYMMGTRERAAVHGNVELGKQKLRKKQRREQRVRQKQNQAAASRRGPEQLN